MQVERLAPIRYEEPWLGAGVAWPATVLHSRFGTPTAPLLCRRVARGATGVKHDRAIDEPYAAAFAIHRRDPRRLRRRHALGPHPWKGARGQSVGADRTTGRVRLLTSSACYGAPRMFL